MLACGEIRLPERLTLAEHRPSVTAVEAPFHGASARSALQLAHARGAVLAALGSAGLPVFEYSPATIKKAVTGQGRAEKHQVEAMVSRLVPGGVSPGKPDMADAVATALCHLFSAGPRELLAQAGVAVRRR